MANGPLEAIATLSKKTNPKVQRNLNARNILVVQLLGLRALSRHATLQELVQVEYANFLFQQAYNDDDVTHSKPEQHDLVEEVDRLLIPLKLYKAEKAEELAHKDRQEGIGCVASGSVIAFLALAVLSITVPMLAASPAAIAGLLTALPQITTFFASAPIGSTFAASALFVMACVLIIYGAITMHQSKKKVDSAVNERSSLTSLSGALVQPGSSKQVELHGDAAFQELMGLN